MSGTIKIGSRNYTWAELSKPDVRRAVLPQVEAMIAAYKKNPEPWHAQGWNDLGMRIAVLWTGGIFDGLTESQMAAYTDEAVSAYNAKAIELGKEPLMATALTQTTQQAPAIDGKSAFRELATLMQDGTVRTALQKRAAGASLTAAEVKKLEHHDALNAANSAQAATEKRARVTRPPRASIAAPIVAPKFKDVDEARARRLELQHDLSSPYHAQSHPDYKQARETVKAAYQLETGETETK